VTPAIGQPPLILALDQGTSSSRAVLYTPEGCQVASASAPLPIGHPADGWVEQDAEPIWESQRQAMRSLEVQLSDQQKAW